MAIPIVLTAGVILFGLLGSRPASAPVPSVGPSQQIAAATSARSVGPSSRLPSRLLPLQSQDPFLPGFVTLNASSATEVGIPSSISSDSLAASGRTLFYIADGTRIEALPLAPNSPAKELVRVAGCQGIDQLALGGVGLVYVVVTPVGPPVDAAGCGSSTLLDWTIWQYDVTTGARRSLAQGVHAVSPARNGALPVHVAATADTFAFERDITLGGYAVEIEVDSYSGQSLWSTRLASPVRSLMVGGDKLAVVTDDPIPRLEIASAASKTMTFLAGPASGASLSPDGTYLAWDTRDSGDWTHRRVVVDDLSTGTQAGSTSIPEMAAAAGPRPVISAGTYGPELAWFAVLQNGTIGPAFVAPALPSGGVFESDDSPVWIGFSGDDLVWVDANLGGMTGEAFVVDLPSLAGAIAP